MQKAWVSAHDSSGSGTSASIGTGEFLAGGRCAERTEEEDDPEPEPAPKYMLDAPVVLRKAWLDLCKVCLACFAYRC